MTFKQEISFVKILLPFVAGIIVGYNLQIVQLIKPAFILLLFIFICLVLINNFYKKLKLYHFKELIGGFYYLMFFLVGFNSALIHTDFLKKDYFANQHYPYLKIIVQEEPQQTNNIIRFVAKVNQTEIDKKPVCLSGNLLVAIKLDTLHPISLKYGDELWIAAKYSEVEPPYNPAEFDFKAWLASKNIYHQTFINQNQIVITRHKQGNRIIDFAISLRKKQVEVYRKIIKNDEAFAVASTLILGYRADLSKETLNAYSKTGTIHALSVSGMHVGLIYLLLNWTLAFCNRKRLLKIGKYFLIGILIWYYALITGLSPSVLRSAIMLSAFMLSQLVNRQQNSYNVISFTAFCILFYNPFLIWDVGFQLSFLAVLGLIYLQPKIYKWIYVKNKIGDKLWQTTAMSLSAQAATFPLSIYYFHQFPVYFLMANLFIFIPITFVMYLGLAILILHTYIFSILNWLNEVFEWTIVFVNNFLKWTSELPFAGISSIWINRFEMILLSIAFFGLIYAFTNYYRKILWFSLILIFGLQCLAFIKTIKTQNQVKIIFFSLRKNYASAYITGNTAILVTDLKMDDKNFDFFVKPALDQMQVSNIKFVQWNTDYHDHQLVKKNHQILFKNKRILLYDESLTHHKIQHTPSFDLVWLHEIKRLKLSNLIKEVKFYSLLIDASVKDYQLESYKTAAKNLNLQLIVIKKNPAYLINLNQ